ncbi:DUF4132 domain-containing protein [Kitasatospora sp. LaBMicrA B282]|uniref:DUF4132 domain-containing protein n=1 Tax=Kitasatospora sp. LaBMicrA B282 TaxID=3420949 RepID=UPI003D13166C
MFWRRFFRLDGGLSLGSAAFPRVHGPRRSPVLMPPELGRRLIRAGKADVLAFRRTGEERAPQTAALLESLDEPTRQVVGLTLQRERIGLLAWDYEWAASVALREVRCGWRASEVRTLFTLALRGVDPVRPTTPWVTAEHCLELPLAAYQELLADRQPGAAERAEFESHLRTVLAACLGCRAEAADEPEPGTTAPDTGLPTAAERVAFARRVRALLPTGFDPDPLLPPGDPFATAARCGLGATLYADHALRLLELCAGSTEIRPDYRWLGRIRELLQLDPDCREVLRVLLVAGRGEPSDCPNRARHQGPPGERGGQLLGALAWAAVVSEDTALIRRLGRALDFHARRSPDELPPGAAHFVRCGLAALAALTGEAGAGQHRRQLAAGSPQAAAQARQELAALRDLPAGVDLTGLTVPVGRYVAVFDVDPVGQVTLRFRNQAGRLLGDVPSQVRERHPARYAVLRARLAELRGQLATYRGALAERLVTDPGTPAARWRTAFLGGPHLAPLSRTLVWEIDTPAGPVQGRPVQPGGSDQWLLRDLTGRMHELTDDTPVRLWHPAPADREQAAAWRAQLAEQGVRQPVAQL